MKIYFGNLPERATVRELLLFIHSHQRNRLMSLWMNEDVEINNCQIIRTVAQNGQVASYGVAHVFPRKRAMKLINRLNGKQFRGREIVVRQYFDRTQARDRRPPGWELENFEEGIDRRTRERRKMVRLDDWDG